MSKTSMMGGIRAAAARFRRFRRFRRAPQRNDDRLR